MVKVGHMTILRTLLPYLVLPVDIVYAGDIATRQT